MGSINFSPKILCDSISETVGYKSGIALSIVNYTPVNESPLL